MAAYDIDMSKTEVLLQEGPYVIFAIQWTEVNDTSVKFIVYYCFQWEIDTNAVSDCEKYLEGYVKWDGCSHFWFGDENGYLHLCGKNAYDRHAYLINKIYEVCSKKITRFNKDVAE